MQSVVCLERILGLLFPAHCGVRFSSFASFDAYVIETRQLFAELCACAGSISTAQRMADDFFAGIRTVYDCLSEDAEWICAGDPSFENRDSVIYASPGFFAIAVYRLANLAARIGLKDIALQWSAVSRRHTGIYIHPDAVIAFPFSIIHGTGVMIDSSAIVRKNVTIHQGVMIGFNESLGIQTDRETYQLLDEHVTVFPYARICGSATVIGACTKIASHVTILESTPSHAYIYRRKEAHFIKPMLKKCYKD